MQFNVWPSKYGWGGNAFAKTLLVRIPYNFVDLLWFVASLCTRWGSSCGWVWVCHVWKK
jgi:hypothetical protein